MRVQRRVLTVEETKICKQHFLITRKSLQKFEFKVYIDFTTLLDLQYCGQI